MRLNPRFRQAAATVVLGMMLGACAHNVPAWRESAAEREREREAPADDNELSLRYVYPGQRIEPAWIAAAVQEDRALARALPRGAEEINRQRTFGTSPGLSLDPLAFTPLGPRPQGDPIHYPQYLSAGRVNTIVVDPVAPNVAYLGGDGSGVWKTTNCCVPYDPDAGAGAPAPTTWQPMTDQSPVLSSAIGDIVIDPNDHNTIYAGTGDLRFSNWSFGSAGLLKSADAGATWSVLGADVFGPLYVPSSGGYPQYQAISKVVVDPADSNRLAVGTKTGVYLSYDAGGSWTGPCYSNAFSSGAGAQRQDITALIATPRSNQPTRLLAAIGARGSPTPTQPDLGNTGANGVYSADWPGSGCPAWTLRNAGWPDGTGDGTTRACNESAADRCVGRIELAVAPTNPQRVYALVADMRLTSPPLGVWRSNDGAATWTQACAGNACAPSGCDGFGQQMWYDAGLSVDPGNADLVWASAQDIMRSSNAGASFSNLTCGYADFEASVHVDHHARAFLAQDSDKLLIGTDGGVYYSRNALDDKPDFAPLNISLNTLELYSGDIGPSFATSSAPWISAGAQDNGSTGKIFDGTPTGPVDWDAYAPGGDGTFTQIEPILGKRWYFSIAYGGIHVTYGNGGLGGGVAPIASRWGGGSPNQERKSLLMPFQLYKFGEVDAPNSGCTSTLGCNHLIAGTYRLWESVVGGIPGTDWYTRTGDLTKNNLILDGQNRSFINALSYAPSDPTRAVVGTSDGNVQVVLGLGVQFNGDCPGAAQACASVVDVTDANAVLPLRPVLDVNFDARDRLTAYAALGGFEQNSPGQPGHVYRLRCVDAACSVHSWENKSGNLPNIPVNAIQPNPKYSAQVFAGTDWGLYYTDNIDATNPQWQRFSGLPGVMVWDMAIDRGYTTLALFTRSRGAWVWPLPDAPDLIFVDGFETTVTP